LPNIIISPALVAAEKKWGWGRSRKMIDARMQQRGTRDFDKAETTAAASMLIPHQYRFREVIGKLLVLEKSFWFERQLEKYLYIHTFACTYCSAKSDGAEKNVEKCKKNSLGFGNAVAAEMRKLLLSAADWNSVCWHLKVNQVWRVHSRECAQIRTNWRKTGGICILAISREKLLAQLSAGD